MRTVFTSIHKHLHRFLKNPLVQILTGVILLIVSIVVMVSALVTDFQLKQHHGFALLGFGLILQAFPNLIQALERIDKWRK